MFTIDQRNHGLSPHSDVWNYEVMADDLKEFIDRHQLKNPILLGHSMGGKTVMFFEIKYPGISAKLIVVDMAPGVVAPRHADVLKALHAVDFSAISTRKEAESIMAEYLSDMGTRQFLLKNIYWKENGRGGSPEEMAWRFNLKGITENYEAVLAGVPDGNSDVDTLLIRGERSEYVEDADVDDFKKRFPNSRLVTIAGSGHWVHAEKPKEFFEAVMGFLQ